MRKTPAEPLPWLYRIAGHTVANHRRGQRRLANLRGRLEGLPATTSALGDPAPVVAESDRVAAALRQIPPKDQEALRPIAWEDLTVADAARAAGVSVTAMKVRLHRARRRLAHVLRPPESGQSQPGGPPLALSKTPETRPNPRTNP